MSDKKYIGTVAWFGGKGGAKKKPDEKSANYGFIEWEKDGVKQKDMFVHYSDIIANGFKILYKGQRVQFSIGVNNDGNPKAIEVEVLKN